MTADPTGPMVRYVRVAPPAAPADIERLERRIGRPLPAGYRKYLIAQDGGRLAGNTGAVQNVLGVNPAAPYWASMWDALDVFADRVPGWLLPVARDEYGNLYALSLRPTDEGSVWFWDHEEEADEGEPPSEANITRVADDWHTFLADLRPV